MFRILIFSANMSRHALHDRVFRYKYGRRMGKKHKQGRLYLKNNTHAENQCIPSSSYSSLVKYLTSKFSCRAMIFRSKCFMSEDSLTPDLKHFFKFWYFIMYFFQHCFLCRVSDPLCRRLRGLNPGMSKLRHWKSDALTIRLDLNQPHLVIDLIRTRLNLIHSQLLSIHFVSELTIQSRLTALLTCCIPATWNLLSYLL
jgi:hypothetical protein